MDTDHAVDGEGLYLSYGSVDEDRQAAVAIGHDVVTALTHRGLHPAWNGKLAFRILLPLRWQRRRDDAGSPGRHHREDETTTAPPPVSSIRRTLFRPSVTALVFAVDPVCE